VFNKDGDRPRGYEYPSPSIKGGSIGAKSTGRLKQLTEDDLERIRRAVSNTKDSSPKSTGIEEKY
jgi:hypothetical protein